MHFFFFLEPNLNNGSETDRDWYKVRGPSGSGSATLDIRQPSLSSLLHPARHFPFLRTPSYYKLVASYLWASSMCTVQQSILSSELNTTSSQPIMLSNISKQLATRRSQQLPISFSRRVSNSLYRWYTDSLTPHIKATDGVAYSRGGEFSIHIFLKK